MHPAVQAHAALMALTIVLLTTAVVFARLKRTGWLGRHRLIASAGAALGLAGVLTIVITKIVKDWPHLGSLHSRIGLAGILLILTAPVLGFLVLGGRGKLRLPHRIVGALAILTAAVAAGLKIF